MWPSLQKWIQVECVASKDNKTDISTKSVPKQKLDALTRMLHISQATSSIQYHKKRTRKELTRKIGAPGTTTAAQTTCADIVLYAEKRKSIATAAVLQSYTRQNPPPPQHASNFRTASRSRKELDKLSIKPHVESDYKETTQFFLQTLIDQD